MACPQSVFHCAHAAVLTDLLAATPTVDLSPAREFMLHSRAIAVATLWLPLYMDEGFT